LFETFFTKINIWSAILDMHVETLVGMHIKCPLLLPDFNQNVYVSTNFS
jgi:hypothetical protein